MRTIVVHFCSNAVEWGIFVWHMANDDNTFILNVICDLVID